MLHDITCDLDKDCTCPAGEDPMNRLELRAWREQRDLTQMQLAEILGVDRITLYRWESGASTVPPFLALALAHLDHLGTTVPRKTAVS
jgi:DNA-binding XRE family transcriptional regulator